MVNRPAYVTRETVLDVGGFGSVIADKIDRAIFAQSRNIDETLHRHFFPLTAAVTFHEPYECSSHVGSSAFWLNSDLQSASGITVDGTANTDYTLLPKEGPPYNRIVIDSFFQVDTIITGVWGYSADTTAAGALSANIAAAGTATCDVTDSSLIGVGDLITINTERMIVTGKTAIDTTVNVNDTLTADANDVTVTVTDGSGFNAGEEILIDSERMLITDIATNDLTVTRAYRGSTLAGHSTATDVYAYRRLSIDRGSTGSTAATHTAADTITVNTPPPVIRDWCLAEVLNQLAQEGSSYARVVGSGDNQREARGAGLVDIRKAGSRLRRVRKAAV